MYSRGIKAVAAVLVLTLMLTCAAIPALAASPSGSVAVVCGFTLNGVETHEEGFSVTAANTEGEQISTIPRGGTVVFTASCPSGYYVSGWAFAVNGEDMIEIPGVNWIISDDMRTFTLALSDDPTITEIQAAAQFLTEPPTEGPVQLKLSASAAPGTPADITERVTLQAANVLMKEITSAEPGQVINVSALGVPAGYHVREWRASAGTFELPLDFDGLNEAEFEVPTQSGEELSIEAIIEPGLSLLLGLTIDGDAANELDVHPVATDRDGKQVSSINVGETVIIGADLPEDYTLETVQLYPYPEEETPTDLSAFVDVADNGENTHSVAVTLKKLPQINGITAVMVFSEPTVLSVTSKPENGGTVAIAPSSPQPGDSVELTATPADGFIFDRWTITSFDTDDLNATVSADNPNVITFVMPARPVQIDAAFEPVRPTLEALLEDARELAGSVEISDDNGAGLSPGDMWTTPEAAEAFSAAIRAAEEALNTPGSNLDRALWELRSAYNTFADSVQSVAASGIEPEIAEINGLKVIMGLVLSPQTGTAASVEALELALEDIDQPMTVTAADGSVPPENATCATGMKAAAADSELEATVVVSGDVLGTGKISLSQLVRIAKAFVGTDPLEGAYLIAADLNGSGAVDLTDVVLAAELYSAFMSSREP